MTPDYLKRTLCGEANCRRNYVYGLRTTRNAKNAGWLVVRGQTPWCPEHRQDYDAPREFERPRVVATELERAAYLDRHERPVKFAETVISLYEEILILDGR